MRRLGLIILSLLLATSCNITPHNEKDKLPKIPIQVTININPSFDENSIIKISDMDSTKLLSVLIKNNWRIDPKEDTFYYYSRSLNIEQSNSIDHAITNIFSTKIPYKEPEVILDGISLGIIQTKGKDSSFIFTHSPDSIKRKEEFTIAANVISAVKAITSDSIIVNYLDDMMSYFRDNKPQRNTPLIKRREPKYHMKYHF